MKTGIITQARMTSTRLPGKIMLEVKNKPLIKYHTDRLLQSGLPVFIATTENSTDDVVVSFAEKEQLSVFRGKEDDVLSRFYYCARENGLTTMVRVTSDCPLIDGGLIRQHVEAYLQRNNPYLYLSNTVTRSFPRGFDFEIFSFTMLEQAFCEAKKDFEREHVTPFFYKNPPAPLTCEAIVTDTDHSHIRITVDTAEDFHLIRKLLVEHQAATLTWKEIVHIFEQHPELLAINSHIEQKKV
jgi:spore coat polysaccharide biosynthesis protein SpsF